jgi:hypothetical protein
MQAQDHPENLNLTVALGDNETALSFLSRMAARNFRSMQDFCLDIKLSLGDFKLGVLDAIRSVARLSGLSSETLAFNAHQRIDGNFVNVRGQKLGRDLCRRRRILVCPCCLRDDIEHAQPDDRHLAPYNRIAWTVATMLTCVKHSVAYVEIRPETPRDHLFDFSRTVGHASIDLPSLAQTARPRKATALEAYVEARLQGTSNSPWLDSMPLHAAIRTTETVGIAAAYGRDAIFKDLTEDECLLAGDAGFRILDGGPASLTAFLEDLTRSFTGRRYLMDEPSIFLGRLYKSFKHDITGEDFMAVRALFAGFVMTNFPVGPGDTILGMPVHERRFHSVATAARTNGLKVSNRIRRLLTARAQQRTTCLPEGHILFDVESADQLCQRESRRLSEIKAAIYLGATVTQMNALLASGHIHHFRNDDGRVRPFIDRADLDAFWNLLSEKSETVKRAASDVCSLSVAVKRSKSTTSEIIQLILDGKVWVGRLESKIRLKSLLLKRAEIVPFMEGKPTFGLNSRETCRRLTVADQALGSLIQAGALTAISYKHRTFKAPLLVITLESIEQFERTYISAFNLAKLHATSNAGIIKLMRSQGIEPAPELSKVPATFFRRDGLP